MGVSHASNLSLISATWLISACAGLPPQTNVNKSDVSLEAALTSVATSLNSFKKTLDSHGGEKLGVQLDTITIQLDLTYNNHDTEKLAVDFSKGLQLGPSWNHEQLIESNRGSKLVITLKHVDTPGGNVVYNNKTSLSKPKFLPK